jgi:hypothetical protein
MESAAGVDAELAWLHASAPPISGESGGPVDLGPSFGGAVRDRDIRASPSPYDSCFVLAMEKPGSNCERVSEFLPENFIDKQMTLVEFTGCLVIFFGRIYGLPC